MILAEIGVPYGSLDQVDLYDSNHNHNAQSSWFTDPYGLCYTLNDRRPASFLPRFFVVDGGRVVSILDGAPPGPEDLISLGAS